MNSRQIQEWILRVIAPVTGLLLLVALVALGDTDDASEAFYILIAALMGLRFAGSGGEK